MRRRGPRGKGWRLDSAVAAMNAEGADGRFDGLAKSLAVPMSLARCGFLVWPPWAGWCDQHPQLRPPRGNRPLRVRGKQPVRDCSPLPWPGAAGRACRFTAKKPSQDLTTWRSDALPLRPCDATLLGGSAAVSGWKICQWLRTLDGWGPERTDLVTVCGPAIGQPLPAGRRCGLN